MLPAKIVKSIILSQYTCKIVIKTPYLSHVAISKTRHTGTPEQHQSVTRNTGTLKILNLLRFEKKNTGGVEWLLVKPGTPEHRNSIIRNTEHRNTKNSSFVEIREKKIPGGVELLLE